MTVRTRLETLLSHGPLSLRELSERLELSMGEVENHLHHLERSLRRRGMQLVIHPARCRQCGFTFTHGRATRPGRCPRCRSTWISPPTLEIAAKK